MNPQNLNKSQFQRMLDRYLKGTSSSHERQFIDQWYDFFGHENLSWNDKTVHSDTEKRMWEAVSKRKLQLVPYTKDEGRPIWSGLGWKWMAVAAILLIGVSASLYFTTSSINESADVLTQNANVTRSVFNTTKQPLPVSLDDGSEILLKPNSSIEFKDLLVGAKREVYLKGEAFFEVAHDAERPFFVYTGDVTTKVLGTSFTISARGSAISVAVRTGRVSVSQTKQKSVDPLHTLTEEIILTPNQKVVYSNEGITQALVDKPARIAANGNTKQMVFDEEPVAVILQALEEAYGVDIVFEESVISSCTLTTTLSDEDLYDRLTIICKAIKGHYQLDGSKIILTSEGCNQKP